MKEIKAIIQPFMLDRVLDALHKIDGLPGCIVSHTTIYPRPGRISQDEHAMEPRARTKIEIVVDDPLVDAVVEAIQIGARTGKKGDGKIFIIECKDVVRVRTGERGVNAI
jgi:nitrogen regulatory protein P-II 1